MNRKSYLAIFVAACAAIAIYFALYPQPILNIVGHKQQKSKDYSNAIPLKVSFKTTKPARLRIAPDLSCEEATNVHNALAAYEAVRKQLFDHVDAAKIPYLDCFLSGSDLDGSAEDVLQRFLTGVFDANVMYGFLKQEFDRTLYRTVREGNLRHGTLAWGSSKLGGVALRAYQTTGQTRFVDLYLKYFEHLMAIRDSVLGFHDDYHDRIMDSWGSANLGRNAGDPSLWVAHVTHFSLIMLPATGFARLIKEDPRLAAYDHYADEIDSFFKSAYRQFDVDLKPAEGTDEVWYWRPLVDKFEATNHMHLQGQALLNMYALTGDEFYADRVRWIIRVFEKGTKIDDNGMIAWNYFPYFQVADAMGDSNARGNSEFVWKAGFSVPFLYQAEHEGFAIDPKIMAATTRTIRDHVVANNDLAQSFHPDDSRSISERDKKTENDNPTSSIIGFLSAAVDDPAIETQITNIIATRHDLFPDGWLGTGEMALGYASKLGGKQTGS